MPSCSRRSAGSTSTVRCTYGAPRIHGQLRRRGHQIGCKRVARLMRTDGLMGVHKRKWRNRRPDIAPAPDRLNRDFTAERPNQRWVADITEFPTGEGKLHVAGVRDLCHRGLVGWSMGRAPTPSSSSTPWLWRLGRAEPDPDGLVHHSDKGGAGGFHRSSQHLDAGGVHGEASGLDDRADGSVADEVAGSAVAPAGDRAPVLA